MVHISRLTAVGILAMALTTTACGNGSAARTPSTTTAAPSTSAPRTSTAPLDPSPRSDGQRLAESVCAHISPAAVAKAYGVKNADPAGDPSWQLGRISFDTCAVSAGDAMSFSNTFGASVGRVTAAQWAAFARAQAAPIGRYRPKVTTLAVASGAFSVFNTAYAFTGDRVVMAEAGNGLPEPAPLSAVLRLAVTAAQQTPTSPAREVLPRCLPADAAVTTILQGPSTVRRDWDDSKGLSCGWASSLGAVTVRVYPVAGASKSLDELVAEAKKYDQPHRAVTGVGTRAWWFGGDGGQLVVQTSDARYVRVRVIADKDAAPAQAAAVAKAFLAP